MWFGRLLMLSASGAIAYVWYDSATSIAEGELRVGIVRAIHYSLLGAGGLYVGWRCTKSRDLALISVGLLLVLAAAPFLFLALLPGESLTDELVAICVVAGGVALAGIFVGIRGAKNLFLEARCVNKVLREKKNADGVGEVRSPHCSKGEDS